MRRYLLLGCALAFAFPAMGEVYKWTDAQGKAHYGDVPPNTEQNAKGVDLNVTEGVSSPRGGSRSSTRTRSVSSRQDAEYGTSSSFCRDLAKYASLQDLRDKGCKLDQGSCSAMRDYLAETRAATGRADSQAARLLGRQMQSEIEQQIQLKGC
ncbi:DUF4124 domain-containing protein [Niveibacterium sp. SC-1]|uniref:DUF4124 domain-containing protein n=1 Tax=Niveibacterium sp. SC-1 TaxID=3135646 RepID=UPI00311E87CB